MFLFVENAVCILVEIQNVKGQNICQLWICQVSCQVVKLQDNLLQTPFLVVEANK
jgi:hypothetical protein